MISDEAYTKRKMVKKHAVFLVVTTAFAGSKKSNYGWTRGVKVFKIVQYISNFS